MHRVHPRQQNIHPFEPMHIGKRQTISTRVNGGNDRDFIAVVVYLTALRKQSRPNREKTSQTEHALALSAVREPDSRILIVLPQDETTRPSPNERQPTARWTPRSRDRQPRAKPRSVSLEEAYARAERGFPKVTGRALEDYVLRVLKNPWGVEREICRRRIAFERKFPEVRREYFPDEIEAWVREGLEFEIQRLYFAGARWAGEQLVRGHLVRMATGPKQRRVFLIIHVRYGSIIGIYTGGRFNRMKQNRRSRQRDAIRRWH